MLMKLTKGVNFIDILRVSFSYKRALRSFSLNTVWLCNFLQKNTEKLLSGTKQVERNQRCWKFNFEVCCVRERRERERERTLEKDKQKGLIEPKIMVSSSN